MTKRLLQNVSRLQLARSTRHSQVSSFQYQKNSVCALCFATLESLLIIHMLSGPRALGVIMPVLILFLDPSRQPPTPLHTQAVTQLLSLAAASPAAFKDATGRLEQSSKDALETSVRQALGSKGQVAEPAKPQISLRSF